MARIFALDQALLAQPSCEGEPTEARHRACRSSSRAGKRHRCGALRQARVDPGPTTKANVIASCEFAVSTRRCGGWLFA